MPLWTTYRTVVLEQRAQIFIDSHSKPDSRFEEQWEGVEWLLSRKPDCGLPRHAQEPNKYLLLVIAASALATTAELWVLYSYDDNNVTVHALAIGPSTPDQ